jgi:hypothetical protein
MIVRTEKYQKRMYRLYRIRNCYKILNKNYFLIKDV